MWQQKRLAFGARQAFEDDEIELFWHLVDKVQPTLYRVKGPSRPVPVVEDMAVRAGSAARFSGADAERAETPSGDRVALLPRRATANCTSSRFSTSTNPDDVQRMRLLAEELYQEVFAVQGSISGEHAYGLSRTAFVRQQAGPLFDVFREVKRIFDPENILNPGQDHRRRSRFDDALSAAAACERPRRLRPHRPPSPLPSRRRGRAGGVAEPCRVAVELGARAGQRRGGRVQSLRRVSHAVGQAAHVPHLSLAARPKKRRRGRRPI